MCKSTFLENRKLIFLSVIVLVEIVGLAIVMNQQPFIRKKSDIFLRWHATNKLLTEGRNLYDAQNGEEIFAIVYGKAPAYETNFYYPAPLLLFTVPLAKLTYPAAHLIWTIFGQLIFFASIAIIVHLTQYPPTVNQLTMLVLGLIIWTPYIQHVIWGQFNTLGVFGLALCLLALHREKYGWAGVALVGLLFKPHATLLILVFLLFWMFFQPARWRFYAGFAAACLFLWAFAAWFQPSWVLDFLHSLGGYIQVTSAIDRLWNPHQVVAIVLVSTTFVLFIRRRHAPFMSSTFIGCLTLGATVWALVVPIAGAYHILILVIPLMLVWKNYHEKRPYLHKYAIISILIIYFAGWVGFLIGLSRPDWYGLHIALTQLAYTTLFPLTLAAWALFLCWPKRPNYAKW